MKHFALLFFAVMAFQLNGFASETVKGAQKDFQTFKQEMTTKLEAAEKKLIELKEKAKTKTSDVKEKTITELEATRDQLKSELNELEEKGQSNWTSLKKGFASSMDKFNKKVQNALKDE